MVLAWHNYPPGELITIAIAYGLTNLVLAILFNILDVLSNGSKIRFLGDVALDSDFENPAE